MVACDVPSGVDASTGEVEGEAVRAAHGHLPRPKLGLYVDPGEEHAGRVEVVEIGVPRGAPAPAGGLISERVLDLYPRRAGGLEVRVGRGGGGRRLARPHRRADDGGPRRATRRRRLRAGGRARVGAAGGELRLLEQMSRGLPDEDGSHTPAGVEVVEEMAERAGAVVLGPGLGRARARRSSLATAARGRGAAARRRRRPQRPRRAARAAASGAAPTVLTPHEGELGRLLDRPSDEIARARLATARGRASAAAPSCCSRATTRSSRSRRRGRGQPGRHPGARHGRHRRRALRPDRRPAGQAPRRLRGRAAWARSRTCWPPAAPRPASAPTTSWPAT